MTSAMPTARRPIRDLVGEAAGGYVTELQQGYLKDQSGAVAALAQLRRGAGKLPQDVPDLWGMFGAERLHSEQTLSESDAIKAEAALFLAVTLYALHQQSRSEQRMHRPGVQLGEAVRRLMPEGSIDDTIRRRFVRVGSASTREALAYRLREIISLLRRESIPLDYALLARQLYQAQIPGGMLLVRQNWGLSFHAYQADTSKAETPSGEDSPTDKDI
ncbi:hypothetical protein GCM10009555_007320 [Acrocarpospora macrocephala]|uniref:Type I-E CRISPR-associated protein Cse2/CasB n=1 Tax=Acrocarpospora macrocephala TaxID=150177 RepID=A0A5M3WZ75_9ACTN|nr:type I-E CRISPR-associated protein Cse2/CasB [Acrocarpospora macrocephala]GES13199.1 hypothetical protein Amac_067960 [Acrocarpospora macrocephala]